MQCVKCLKMEYGVVEGIASDFVDFDFVDDALEFELQLAEAREVKFTQPLTEALVIGSHIVVTGTPCEDIPWFAINIGCGSEVSGQSEIAVHFNIRLPQYYVVRNTRHRGKWGIEETTSFRPFPFKLDKTFTIEVVVDETQTLWAVDGHHYCSYAHRTPTPLLATYIQVVGIKDASLSIQKTDVYPALAPPPLEVPARQSIDAPEESEPTWFSNVIATLPNGIPEGHQIVVHGRLRPMLHSFAIDLLDVAREWPAPNILVHVNVRAHDEAARARQLVVLNAWFGAWGDERRQRTAALVPASKTTFRIARAPASWTVYADDIMIGELEYRGSPNGVRALRVRGDLTPETIFTCPMSSSPITPGPDCS